ncbi:hypothetical protein AHAS_Ahas13G0377600 [Arachis hypogaea]
MSGKGGYSDEKVSSGASGEGAGAGAGQRKIHPPGSFSNFPASRSKVKHSIIRDMFKGSHGSSHNHKNS